MKKRVFLKTTAALAAAAAFGSASAQTTPIKFQLDWRFEGPAALFLVPAAKGYFKDAKLDVTIDAGNGSGGTVTRVASGTYDMGFADLAALMEFHANNPDAPNKPVAVMMVYNNTPAAVMALKKSGIKTPADLNGKKLGAPVFDAGRRAFPIFAKANNVSGVQWTSMDPPLRETMLMRGDVDAITGFTFTSLLNLEARGAKADDVVVLANTNFDQVTVTEAAGKAGKVSINGAFSLSGGTLSVAAGWRRIDDVILERLTQDARGWRRAPEFVARAPTRPSLLAPQTDRADFHQRARTRRARRGAA